jgi:uncharacterized repeat protein (TIGR01451 family)
MKQKIYRLFAFLIVLALVATPVSADQHTTTQEIIVEPFSFEFEEVPASLPRSETGIYIVRLADPALASYEGDIADLEATSPRVTGETKLNVDAPHSRAYLNYLEGQQRQFISQMNSTLGRSVDVPFQYMNVLNALAVEVSHAEAVTLTKLPGVIAVFPDTLHEIETDVGPTLIGAPAIWEGDTGTGVETKGEGIIVGMLDTGINPLHPSFAEVDGDGYLHQNPYGSGNFVGVCADPMGVDYEDICNDKLIGAWNFHPSSPNAQDWNNHGSHVGSTIAGNKHEATFDVGVSTFTRTISGVAPRANVISYLVCYPSCPSSSSVAAVNQAIADGVDVLNYSISGGDTPWTDAVDLAFLDAYAAGMFISASAGNTGPGASTVAKTGPWNAAVAASTHNRVIANTVDVLTPTPPEVLEGMAAVPGSGPEIDADITALVIWAGHVDFENVRGCSAFPVDSFTDAIALIQRGDCTFETKVTNATNAGAVAVIVYNHVGGPPTVMGALETTTIQSVMVAKGDGDALVDFISGASPDPVEVRINLATSVVVDDDWQNIIAGFSSRGPSQWDLLKPDYTAPGVNILAAGMEVGGDPEKYAFLQGTSMSSPHGAGAAALMKALFPSWSPSEIKSALAMTAYEGLLKEDGATPADYFDMGSGLLDLTLASKVGLVLDETHANFVAADPGIGGQPRNLNMPSMVDTACLGECSWTRMVKNVLPTATTYSVSVEAPDGMLVTASPTQFTIPAGGQVGLWVGVDLIQFPQNTWAFAKVILSPSDGSDLADLQLPIAAFVAPSTNPAALIKEVDLAEVLPGDNLEYTITLNNLHPDETTFTVTDVIPDNSAYVAGSATGGLVYDPATDTLSWTGDLGGRLLEVNEGVSPFGYFSLASLGVTPFPLPANADEGAWIVSGFDFFYLGDHYTQVIWSINGTVEAGTASLMAASWDNQELPDPTLPNNILAPWWTDLDLTDSGNWYLAVLSAGANTYYVFEWEDAPLWDGYANPAIFTFQIWIQVGTDNIWFVYDDMDTALWPWGTVGAEDSAGILGMSYYYDGDGTAPSSATDLAVETVSSPPAVFTFEVTATGERGDLIVNEVVADDGLLAEKAWVASKIVDFGLELEPPTDTRVGSPGSTVEYTLSLTNTGDLTDTFSIAVGDSEWDVHLPETEFTLEIGESAEVIVHVDIPAETADGATDSVTITATSQGDNSLSASAVLTTTAGWYQYFMPLISKDAGIMETFSLTILHTNDFHARVDEYNRNGARCTEADADAGLCIAGAPRLATVVDDIRAKTGNLLVLDAGDQFQGTLFFTLFQGEVLNETMNYIGYDAMAVGNHEFDSGPGALVDFIQGADFPVISTNIEIDALEEPELASLIEPYVILERGGHEIGIIGLITPDTDNISSPGPNVTFTDPLTSLQATADELMALGVDKIIALTHLGYDYDLELAESVSGVDIIIGGHSHSFTYTPTDPIKFGPPEFPQFAPLAPVGEYPTVVQSPADEPVLVVTAYQWGTFLGNLQVTFDHQGLVVTYGGNPIFLGADVEKDAVLDAMLDPYREAVQDLIQEVVGETTVDLPIIEEGLQICRLGECLMGNLVADAMLWMANEIEPEAGYQIAFQNGGGLRAPIMAGEVTMGDILETLPFGNTIATFELQGTYVKAALENGASRYPSANGGFAQVAGLRYTIDPAQEVGERIVSVEVWNGTVWEALDPDAMYKVVTNDFMRRGGDNYTMFRDFAVDPYDFGPLLDEALADYFMEFSPVTPEIEGRITILD